MPTKSVSNDPCLTAPGIIGADESESEPSDEGSDAIIDVKKGGHGQGETSEVWDPLLGAGDPFENLSDRRLW